VPLVRQATSYSCGAAAEPELITEAALRKGLSAAGWIRMTLLEAARREGQR
jgi:predicted double-glycine peptidase